MRVSAPGANPTEWGALAMQTRLGPEEQLEEAWNLNHPKGKSKREKETKSLVE